MTDKDWTLRWYQAGDEGGILDCLISAFGEWPTVESNVSPLEHLRWKLQGPFAEPTISYVALVEGRVIGCSLGFHQRVKNQQQTLLAGHYTDFAIHPEFQGQGLMKDLWPFGRDLLESTLDLGMGMSANETVVRTIEREARRRHPANQIDLLDCAVPEASPGAATGDVRIETAALFDARVDAFWEEASRPFDLIIARTRDYLNWRYADPRAGDFTIRVAASGRRMLGYTVLARSRGRGVFADLLVVPERPDVLDALIVDGLHRLAARDCTTVRCWSPKVHPYHERLLHHGFRAKRVVDRFTMTPHRDLVLRALSDPKGSVHFTVGDTDIV